MFTCWKGSKQHMPKAIYPQEQLVYVWRSGPAPGRKWQQVTVESLQWSSSQEEHQGLLLKLTIMSVYSVCSQLKLVWGEGVMCHFLTVLGSVSMAVGGKGPPPNTSQVTPSLREVQVRTQGRVHTRCFTGWFPMACSACRQAAPRGLRIARVWGRSHLHETLSCREGVYYGRGSHVYSTTEARSQHQASSFFDSSRLGRKWAPETVLAPPPLS